MKAIFKKFTLLMLCLAMMLCATITPSAAASANAFKDVKQGAWYTKSVNYVVEKGLMAGVSTTLFGTTTKLTRAMTVTIIAKLVNADTSAYASSVFDDVPAGKWFTKAVGWAKANNIVDGTSATTFNPNGNVTREQLALMLYKLSLKYDITNSYSQEKELSDFSDEAEVSTWARNAVKWALNTGIISGNTATTLNPKGYATRAEAATIFYNVDYIMDNDMLPPNTSDADKLTIKKSSTPRIICWGDSLTAGYVPPTYTGIECPYPEALAKISGLTVINYGVSSETSTQIAMRQGGKVVYAMPFTIPADCTEVEFYPIDEYGNPAEIGYYGATKEDVKFSKYYGYKAINEVTIAGVKGTLTVNQRTDTWYFKRSEPGEEVYVNRYTQIVTYGMADRQSNDITVIWAGSNDFHTGGTIEEIVENIKSMIAYAETDRYVIINFTAKNLPISDINGANAKLKEEFGDHVVDVYSFFLDLSENGALAEAGITPTAQDLDDIANGIPPQSLRSDSLHGNNIFYGQVAQKVYNKILELGYLK